MSLASDQLESAGVEPWLVAAMQGLARDGDGRSLEPWLTAVGGEVAIAGTQAICRTHFVRLDAQGRVRVPQLVRMLADQVVDYCVPRSTIQEAHAHFDRTGSTAKILRLQAEAKSLFTKVKNSGEGGELLLYALLEIGLGLPQVLCKMPLKTNTQLHYNGVDGVHAKALENGRLAVYWGEAKLYERVNQAIDAAMKSLAPYLLDAGGGEAERDVLLLRENLDAGDPALTEALKRYFAEDTGEASQLVVRGACLVGFDRSDYQHPLSEDGASVLAEVAEAVRTWQTRVADAIAAERIHAFELEVFLLPLPSVQDFRDALHTELGLS